MARPSELFVVAGNEENAEGRREFVKRRSKSVGIGLCAVEKVTGHEDDVGFKVPRLGSDSPRETDAVDVAQVQVGHKECLAAAPCSGEIGKVHRHSANPDPARVQNAIDSRQNGRAKENARDPRTGMQVGCAGEQQAKCEVDDPAKAGCHKQES